MKPLIVLLAVCALGYGFDHWQALAERHGTVASNNSHELIIYGAKSSSACVQLEGELKKLGIPFENRDLSRSGVAQELNEKLARVGKMGGSVPMPVAEVDGVLVEGATVADISHRLR
jgi:hypothetical protein